MRKLMIILCAMLCVTLSCSALELHVETQNGPGGAVAYPVADDESVNAHLRATLAVDEAISLLTGGAEMTGDTHVYTLDTGDTRVTSVCFTVSGNIRFGRYAQETHAALLNADTGEALPIDSVLGVTEDEAALAAEAYLWDVQDTLNAYLDAGELVPVPLDNVCFDARGMTIHYPAERFSYFSGNAGAVELRWYELEQLLGRTMPCAQMSAEEVLSAAAEGMLADVHELHVGDGLHATLEAYGTLTEPDYITDGEIYEFECAALRGVYAIAARGAESDEAAKITAVRSNRVQLGALSTGVSTRNDAHAFLGEPAEGESLDADTAEYLRLQEGMVDIYRTGDNKLRLYYDADGCFYAAEVAAGE